MPSAGSCWPLSARWEITKPAAGDDRPFAVLSGHHQARPFHPHGLHVSILILIVLAVLVWFILNKTMLGRGDLRLGGDRSAAERAGFNIRRIQLFIYCFVGFLAGIGGIVHSALVRTARPFDLVGTEMSVIAAVVLGGARITGGKGSVVGTMLGVVLVVIMNTSLILLGVSSFWGNARCLDS